MKATASSVKGVSAICDASTVISTITSLMPFKWGIKHNLQYTYLFTDSRFADVTDACKDFADDRASFLEGTFRLAKTKTPAVGENVSDFFYNIR